MKSRPGFWITIWLLAIIHLTSLFAGFFAPYDPSGQHRESVFHAPMRLHWIDQAGVAHLRPFVIERQTTYPVRFFVSGVEYRLFGMISCQRRLFGVDPPGTLFLLGTDGYGRDQLSRLLYGSQIPLSAAWMATIISISLGLSLGTVAGFYPGWPDELIMRLAEAFLALPWLYLLLGVRAFLPLNASPSTVYPMLVCLLGFLGWARPARLIRAAALAARTRGYVVAARAFGASDWYLLRAHIVPETWVVALTQTTLVLPRYVMAEVTLSFLGLGVNEPAPSWGNMLSALQQYYVLASCWWMLLPALAPFAVSLCCFRIADELLHKRRPVPL